MTRVAGFVLRRLLLNIVRGRIHPGGQAAEVWLKIAAIVVIGIHCSRDVTQHNIFIGSVVIRGRIPADEKGQVIALGFIKWIAGLIADRHVAAIAGGIGN